MDPPVEVATMLTLCGIRARYSIRKFSWLLSNIRTFKSVEMPDQLMVTYTDWVRAVEQVL